ncbi:hypothetical protein D3C78_1090990 [compost metagenome]
MDVGNAIAVGKLQGSVALEERHHVRRRFKECVDHLRVETLAQFMLQVGAWLRTIFDYSRALGQWVARYPHPATGPSGGTAEYRVLFYHDDFLTMPGSCHRCG